MAISEWIPSTYKNKNKTQNHYFHRIHVQFCWRIPEDIVIIGVTAMCKSVSLKTYLMGHSAQAEDSIVEDLHPM